MLKRYGVGAASIAAFSIVGPTLIGLLTFGVYALLDGTSHGPLNAQLIFVSLSLINILEFPMSFLSTVLSSIVDAHVSIARVYAFLVSEELDPESVHHYIMPTSPVGRSRSRERDVIVMRNASFSWEAFDVDSPTLTNISLNCASQELLAIVGRVGQCLER